MSALASVPPFFLNVLILNKDEVVRAKAAEKVPAGFFGIAGRLAAGAAAALVSDDKFAASVSDKLLEAIPAKVADMGITLALTVSYRRGPLVVLRAQVTKVDTPVLLARAKGDEFAAKYAALLELIDFFGATEARANVELKVRDKVVDGLLGRLEELLPAKLQEAGIAVTVTAKRDTDQAEHFFGVLASLDGAAAK